MTNILLIVLFVLGAIVIFHHLVLPLFAYWLSAMPDRYCLTEMEWDSFLSERSVSFFPIHEQLLKLGFYPIGASSLAMSHSSNSFAVYRHTEGTATACLMSLTSSQKEILSLDFTQRYEDGVHLSLTNSRFPEVFPTWFRKIHYRLPDVTDASVLFSKFNAIASSLGRPGAVPLPTGREFQTIAEYLNDELRELTSNGFARTPVGDGTLRLSLRAAYISTWRVIWPWKLILNRNDSHRADRAATP